MKAVSLRRRFGCLFALALVSCGLPPVYAQLSTKNVFAAGIGVSTIPLLSGEAKGGGLGPLVEYERLAAPGRKRSIVFNVGYYRPGIALRGNPLLQGKYSGPERTGFAVIGLGLRHYAGGVDKKPVRYFYGFLVQAGIGNGPSGVVTKDGQPEKQSRFFAGLSFSNGVSAQIGKAIRARIEANAGMGTDNGVGYKGYSLGPRFMLGASATVGYRF